MELADAIEPVPEGPIGPSASISAGDPELDRLALEATGMVMRGARRPPRRLWNLGREEELVEAGAYSRDSDRRMNRRADYGSNHSRGSRWTLVKGGAGISDRVTPGPFRTCL